MLSACICFFTFVDYNVMNIPKYFICALLLAGCSTLSSPVKEHESIIGTWEYRERVSGTKSSFISGSPDLGLMSTDLETVKLVFEDGFCKVFEDNDLIQETFYEIQHDEDGLTWLKLSKSHVFPGESKPLLHGYGSLPLSFMGDNSIHLRHNGMGTLEFKRIPYETQK